MLGIIKQVMGLRQFSMRGLDKVVGEWTLATLAWNVKRINVLKMGAVRAFPPLKGRSGVPQGYIEVNLESLMTTNRQTWEAKRTRQL